MVGSVSNSTSALGSLAAGGQSAAKDVNFDTFLKLLVTQLQNQDPLNPMEGTEFTSQIAQFSALEQQIGTNKHLENLAAAQEYSGQVLAVSYIGKEALLPGAGVETTTAGEKVEFGYKVEANAKSNIIEIYAAGGKVVRTINGQLGEGFHQESWDGLDDDGKPVPAGSYVFGTSAYDANDKKVVVSTYTYDVIKSVEGNGSNVFVKSVNGRDSALGDVISVRDPVL